MAKTTARWTEEQHLLSLTPDLRRKVGAILSRMRELGFKPKIAESMRTIEEQKEMIRRGVSRTTKSNHVRPFGAVRAVDIVDAKTGWGASRAFWLTLGRLALLHGCNWGGLWGLGIAERKRLRRFLVADWEKWTVDLHKYQGGLGWDVAHVEL